MEQKKTILILDDHPMFREGLKTIIESDARFEVIGEASNAREGLRMAKKSNPDLILMDISLPDQSGIRLTYEIKEYLPDARVMIVSMHSKTDYIAGAFQAGASGYMVKDSTSAKLLHGLESISNGEYFIDSSIFPQLVDVLKQFSKKEAKVADVAYNTLTEREKEIMVMLAEGFTIEVIAEKLFISPKTVKNHRAAIMGKLELHGFHELMRYAAKIGLIDVDLWKT
jgi:DNA-binding NarL/FixJ family response regulator